MEHQRILKSLEKSKESDKAEIERYKKDLISDLHGKTKEDIIPKQKKLSLWQRIKKALNF
jgi:F0F1-type ATP synthase membrane subunit b/b'